MFFKRLAFVSFVENMMAASRDQHANEVRDKILPKCKTQTEFVKEFAPLPSSAAVGATALVADGTIEEEISAVGEDDEADGAGGHAGLSHATATKYEAFAKDLTPTGKAFATMLRQTHVGGYDEEFKDIADFELKPNGAAFNWTALFSGEQGKINGMALPLLQADCAAWLSSTTTHLSSAVGDDDAAGAASAIGDTDRILSIAQNNGDDDNLRQKVIEKLQEVMRTKLRMETITDYTSGEMVRVMKNYGPFQASWTVNEGTQKSSNSSTLYLLCAELFPPHNYIAGPDAHRGVAALAKPEFKAMIQWMLTAKRGSDVIAIADGRSDYTRNKIREILTSAVGEEFIEAWVTYDMETSLNTDPRNPKRKLAWSGANMETLFLCLPDKGRLGGQIHLVARDVYTHSGESTNFCRTYTGVPYRRMAELPRISAELKVQFFGSAAVGAINRDRVAKDVEANGHPLFWGEWKPVKLYSTFYPDLEITDIVDLSPGSGAASIAAMYNEVPYFGISSNAKYSKWFQDHLQKVFLALVYNEEISVEKSVSKNVGQYLQRSAEAAVCLLPEDDKTFLACANGADDSEGD